ncbi:hypothetical protein Q5P01_018724 [Channa striata]|uniref:chitin synthase n=1 Tax=Channa striata TaxID=64152 RepID=A0AA88M779_CHASR|nr:hypothetical protein Q5P01_018724 [Channa striata]
MNEQNQRPWDTGREVPAIEDEQTPWKLIKLLKIITLMSVSLIVFGLALCSKASFLVLITLSNEGTKILPADQKPVALLCIGCCLIASSVLLLLKSFWKACYKTSKLPRVSTVALVIFFEFLVSGGAAILTIVAMPHFDIVTNVTILNGVAILSGLLQVISQCTAQERNRFLLPSIASIVLILLGYGLFVYLYITKNLADVKMAVWVGLAVGACFLISFNWWESYFRLISKNSSSIFLKRLCRDLSKCENILHIISSLLRIVVTACILGAYVPLAKMDWNIVTSIPSYQTRIIVITVGVQLVSSALCHWFALAACKMHALRRCFILPLYLASLAVMALFVIPIIVYYQDYKSVVPGITFPGYCSAVEERNITLSAGVFPQLVLDVTHTLCFLDMSKMADIGILTGSSVSWWLGLLLATIHLWYLNVNRIQRTQDLFIRRLYEGAFIEQSLLLNTRFDIQIKGRKKCRIAETAKVYLCATMWHETFDEMMKIIISIFRLDKYRPKVDPKYNDFTFEAHIYFDDAFEHIEGGEGCRLNNYAKNLVEIITVVYGTFTHMNDKLFKKQHKIPDQKIIRTTYGGRLVITMPSGNNIIVHFKNKELIRHKKRWSQVMYFYYLLGYKLMTKYYKRMRRGETEEDLKHDVKAEKHNTYILALDGDTDFQPAAVMLLIDRLKMYPRVGAACGRIHPTGSGPAVWFQKFEYAVSHWLQKSAEHVIGCVLCSPGCFSLFRAEALMDDNVMRRYATKSTEASHYIQYDQGEDRWLCTLLLKQGWRVEYNAASDAYTNAPEDFKELFNQRRRWGPSTLGNVTDLLGDTKIISKRNQSMSKPYLFYQLFGLISAILAPATICLLVAGSLSFMTDMNSTVALVIAIIPPIIYLIICFKLKADTQITVAGVLSIMYAFLMLVVTMSIIGSMVKEKTILTPAAMFVIIIAGMYIITAILHPQEFLLVFYGLLYILCIPSAYLLLTIYSMVNMNNVSWGTRETKPAAGAEKPAAPTPKKALEKAKSTFQRLFSCTKCCKKSSQASEGGQLNVNQENMIQETIELERQPQNTIIESVEEEYTDIQPISDVASLSVVQDWLEELQELSTNWEMDLIEDRLDLEERQFWEELQEVYLKPLPDDKERQKKVARELKELRNKINFAFFMINALWLVATFTLQINSSIFAIHIPKVEFNNTGTSIDIVVYHNTTAVPDIKVEPISFMFILGFAISVVIQFLAMIYHRITTLIHYVAFLDTEPREKKPEEEFYLPGKKVEPVSSQDSIATSQEESEPEDSEDEFYSMGANTRV